MLSKNALTRRLKRSFLKSDHRYFAVCSPGFEHELGQEIEALEVAHSPQFVKGGVEFYGPLDLVYEANLRLNTANRLLLRLKDFPAHSFPMLFNQAQRIPWEFIIPDGASFVVRASASNSRLNMKRRLIDTCQSAISRRLDDLGIKSTYDDGGDLEFLLRISSDRATISFNTTGLNLHKRGYKQYSMQAPIRETLAAGVLMRLGHQSFDLLVDPFCGSGTFILEAARMASHIAPGANRSFAYMHSSFFNKRMHDASIRRANEGASAATGKTFLGFDVSTHAIQAARSNADAAGLGKVVQFDKSDFRDVDYSLLGRGKANKLLVCNPPYGRRIHIDRDDEQPLFAHFASLTSWTIAIVTPDETHRLLGRRDVSTPETAYEVSHFSNGGISTSLHVFRPR
jgi:putative N6-adenine-specific DNA methylase